MIEDSEESAAIPVHPAKEGLQAPRVIEANEVKEEIRGKGARVGGVHQEM